MKGDLVVEGSAQRNSEIPARRKLTDYGEFWILGSVFGFAAAYLCDRIAVVSVSPLVGPVMKNLPSLIFSTFLLLRQQRYRQLSPASDQFVGRSVVVWFMASGAAATAGLMLYFFAINVGGVVITPPFLQTQMIWATLFAFVFLKEELHVVGWLGLGLCVIGLMTLSFGQSLGRPVSAQWYLAIPLACGAAACYAVTGALTRRGQLEGAHQATGMFLRFTTSISLAFLVLLIGGGLGSLLTAQWEDLGMLFLSGILSGPVAVYCFFIALRLMSVGRTFAFNGLNQVVAAVLAVFFLGEFINLPMGLGILATFVGVTLVQLYKPAEEKRV